MYEHEAERFYKVMSKLVKYLDESVRFFCLVYSTEPLTLGYYFFHRWCRENFYRGRIRYRDNLQETRVQLTFYEATRTLAFSILIWKGKGKGEGLVLQILM